MITSFRHRRTPRILSALSIILATGLSFAPGTARAWSSTLQVGVEANNNVSQSVRQEKSDVALTAALDFSTLHIIDRDWQLSYGGSLQTSAWQDYSGLNLSELGAHATLRRKFGLGPYAPRLEVRAEVAHQFSKIDDWSGNWVRASVALRKRFSPEWQISLTEEYDQLHAGRDVYSTLNTATVAQIDYDPTEEWRLSLSVSYINGDILSWCRASWPPFIGTNPWTDGIFGGDWFPYDTTGHTIAGGINLSRALGPNSTLSLGYDAKESTTIKNHVYRIHVIRLQLIHAF